MKNQFATRNDLRNWLDSVTTNWDGRTDVDLDAMADWIQRDSSRPNWGSDWSEYCESLDLEGILTGLGR